MTKALERLDPIRAAQVLTSLNTFLAEEVRKPAASVPKYARLENAIVKAIDAGVVVEGDKLPSEAELTTISSFSLGTVQKALKALTDSGRIKRKTGVGTIVQTSIQSMRQPLHARFSKRGGSLLPVFPKLIGRVVMREYGPWTDAIGEDAKIARLDRRIEIGDEIVVLSKFYIDISKYPVFWNRSYEQLHTENFKLLLQMETGQKVRHLDHKITFVAAPDEVISQIDVEPGATVLNVKLTAWNQSNEVLYYQDFHVPLNDLDLTIESLI